MKFMKKGEEIKLADKVDKHYSSAGPHNKSFMCRHYYGAYFVCLFALVIVTASLLNNGSVFAAPGTLTISIPDTISLDVLPSASGTFASTSSNITVRTTYAHGYTLGIAAKTANSNALINTNDSSKTIPSITSAISESTFSGNTSYNNKWGYSPSKYNSTTNTNYLVAPTSTTMATLDKTSAANSTDNTYTIKLGARIDGTLAPGTYENTFVFTVTPNATPYTINYNANTTDTVTNMPSPNPLTGQTFYTSVNIPNTVPVRDGHTFKGWCTVQVTDDASCSGTIYNPDGDGTNLAVSIDQTATSNNITLYAVWETIISMQSMSDDDCVTSRSITIKDDRDGKVYSAQRLADNQCWMTKDLNLAGGTALTSSDTDFDSSYTIPTTDGWQSGGRLPSSSLSGFDPDIGDNYAFVYNTSYAGYYSWDAATLGSGRNISTNNTDAPYSICPKGWHLPNTRTGTDSTSDFRGLVIGLGGSSSISAYDSSTSPTGATMANALLAAPNNFKKSGYAFKGKTIGFSLAYYWSSTSSGSSSGARHLSLSSSSVNTASTIHRVYGQPVRCVKKSIQNTSYLQDIDDDVAKTMAPGTVYTKKDRRDEQSYKIAKLADGNIWMLDNLRLDPTSVTLENLQGNTNASNTTLGYLKNGGGSSPYPATGVSSTWSAVYYNPIVITTYKNTSVTNYGAGSGKVGVYYNYCAASAGSYCYAGGSGTGDATEDICPAGWQLPSSGNNSDFSVLCDIYNGSACSTSGFVSMDATSNTSLQYNLSTPLSGTYYSQAQNQNTAGNFWSSTFNSSLHMYTFNVYADSVGFWSGVRNERSRADTIRCVK